MVAKAKLYLDPQSHQYIGSTKAVVGVLKGDTKKRWEELNKELRTYATLHPEELPIGTGITDLSANAPHTYLLRRGNWDAPASEVEPGFLSMLHPEPARIEPVASPCSTGRRAALAIAGLSHRQAYPDIFAITLDSVTQDVKVDASGNFSATFDATSRVAAGVVLRAMQDSLAAAKGPQRGLLAASVWVHFGPKSKREAILPRDQNDSALRPRHQAEVMFLGYLRPSGARHSGTAPREHPGRSPSLRRDAPIDLHR
jgi:hypothetical protein